VFILTSSYVWMTLPMVDRIDTYQSEHLTPKGLHTLFSFQGLIAHKLGL